MIILEGTLKVLEKRSVEKNWKENVREKNQRRGRFSWYTVTMNLAFIISSFLLLPPFFVFSSSSLSIFLLSYPWPIFSSFLLQFYGIVVADLMSILEQNGARSNYLSLWP